MKGQRGNNLLWGGDNDETVFSRSCRDTLIGGGSNDTFRGDNRTDVYSLPIDEEVNLFREFSSRKDKIGLTDGLTLDALSFASVGRTTTVSVENDVLTIVQTDRNGESEIESNFKKPEF